ncbi:hypothetical protein HMPREF0262_00126 [Clostridium sp. ATCC 29733]|nr:hypothetical protein HMPREF0262_00126 [Clostridium sp. ATCC 29733]
MLLHFQHAADDFTIFIKAFRRMGMQDDFFFSADQFLLNLIAIVRMGVNRSFFLPANGFLRIALRGMSMAFLRLFAYKIPLCVITSGILRTNQRPLRSVARFCVDMPFMMDMTDGFLQTAGRLRRLITGDIMDMTCLLFESADLHAAFPVTGSIMGMRLDFVKGAYEGSILRVAGIIMRMDDKVRISADDIALCIIAIILVCMDVDLAFQHLWGIFHCDGRQDHSSRRHDNS